MSFEQWAFEKKFDFALSTLAIFVENRCFAPISENKEKRKMKPNKVKDKAFKNALNAYIFYALQYFLNDRI